MVPPLIVRRACELRLDWIAITDHHSADNVRAVVAAGGHVLVRLRWNHSAMRDRRGRRFRAVERAQALRVGKVGEWAVEMTAGGAPPVAGRVIALRLPAPLAARAARRVRRRVSKLGYAQADPRSLRAAHFVFVFTTVPRELLGAAAVLDLYRYRWQIEVAFKRLKQLLKLGRLPHQEPRAARAWILAKLVVALLLEKLYRQARLFSPWGYRLAIRSSPTR